LRLGIARLLGLHPSPRNVSIMSDRLRAEGAAAAVAAAAVGGLSVSASPGVTGRCPAAVADARDLGRFAFNRQGQLELLDPVTCSARCWSYHRRLAGTVVSIKSREPASLRIFKWSGGQAGWRQPFA